MPMLFGRVGGDAMETAYLLSRLAHCLEVRLWQTRSTKNGSYIRPSLLDIDGGGDLTIFVLLPVIGERYDICTIFHWAWISGQGIKSRDGSCEKSGGGKPCGVVHSSSIRRVSVTYTGRIIGLASVLDNKVSS